jgi:hypothetical protein
MGWLFHHGATRADIIKHCTRFEENDYGRWTTLEHCTRGNVLWRVFEWHRKDTGVTRNIIGCYLLAADAASGWGYKDLDESMCPYYYSCPPAYLDMAPETNAEWRRRVREHHAQRNRKVVAASL